MSYSSQEGLLKNDALSSMSRRQREKNRYKKAVRQTDAHDHADSKALDEMKEAAETEEVFLKY